MNPRRLSGLAAIALAVSLTGCSSSGDEPDPIPEPSASTGASASPPPDAPELSADEQQAYMEAAAVYADYAAYVARVSKDPDTTEGVNEILDLATPDAISSLNDEVQTLITNEAYVEGEREVAWTVPVEVSSTEVVIDECRTPGTWTLVGKDGQRAPQTGGSVNKVRLTEVDGDWYVSGTDGSDRPC